MVLQTLKALRARTPKGASTGLTDNEISAFAARDPHLQLAVDEAVRRFDEIEKEFPNLVKTSETDLIPQLASDFLNFYAAETVSPFVPLSAKGPWIITLGGAVLYETGGYGMLGQGHDPDSLRPSLAQPQVMANIMTPSFSQYRFSNKLKSKIGYLHSSGTCPYGKFICMNSGSEGVGVALRISDAHAKKITDPSGKHCGKTIRILSFEGSFHGRTYRAARISSSSRKRYDTYLASFRDHRDHVEVRVNDAAHLRELYDRFEKENTYIELLAIEPVMGEGNPGQALSVEFYNVARELTKQHNTILLIDSIQAGLRAQGTLSVIDYPGFEQCAPPDIEVFSKALNGGQFPLSVVGLQQWIADEYIAGIYGNTMTANPRALDIASCVLDAVTPALTENIQKRGKEFLQKLQTLQQEFPKAITKVQGTGLLISAELREDIPVVGFDGVEQRLRRAGINVVHGGKNALRYTPWFLISSEEIDLMVDKTRNAIQEFA
ncbi:MAG: aminotransferase class III-fold pyridoxal phosphate-dependent enzyme [Bdellovibrionales bacterium]|nr:aminotransferase class III-fold pyridoxal phosphate-dependent enzyme [Bdellovibrionales bacterium]